MLRIQVDDLADPRLDCYRDLPSAKQERQSPHFIVEGAWLVERLAASPLETESILVDESQAELEMDELPAATPVYVLPAGALDALLGFRFHRGVLACGRRPAPRRWAEVVPPPPAQLLAVVACHLADPENLGGIIRNAAAFGAHALAVDGASCDPFARRVVRVSMGAVFRLPIIQFEPQQNWFEELRAHEIETVAAVLDPQAEPLPTAPRSQRQALLFGNEGFGLDAEWVRRCDRQVTIPLPGNVDSLNAAVASGICLYHFHRP